LCCMISETKYFASAKYQPTTFLWNDFWVDFIENTTKKLLIQTHIQICLH
jgi:hypothetical protein